MPYLPLSPKARSVLAELEARAANRTDVHAEEYNTFTEDDSVNGIECAAVRHGNHPPVPGRSASSRMIR